MQISNQDLNFLIKSAEKYYNGGDKKEGAKIYYRISNLDSFLIESEFPESFFFTYNTPSWKKFLPQLPTLCLYTTKKGLRIKPGHFKSD